jgi:hypothetical protein
VLGQDVQSVISRMTDRQGSRRRNLEVLNSCSRDESRRCRIFCEESQDSHLDCDLNFTLLSLIARALSRQQHPHAPVLGHLRPLTHFKPISVPDSRRTVLCPILWNIIARKKQTFAIEPQPRALFASITRQVRRNKISLLVCSLASTIKLIQGTPCSYKLAAFLALSKLKGRPRSRWM